jgi:hypothetical protein
MLLVPALGAEVNVIVVPLMVYAELGCCTTLLMTAITSLGEFTLRDKVNAVVEPSPLK